MCIFTEKWSKRWSCVRYSVLIAFANICYRGNTHVRIRDTYVYVKKHTYRNVVRYAYMQYGVEHRAFFILFPKKNAVFILLFYVLYTGKCNMNGSRVRSHAVYVYTHIIRSTYVHIRIYSYPHIIVLSCHHHLIYSRARITILI